MLERRAASWIVLGALVGVVSGQRAQVDYTTPGLKAAPRRGQAGTANDGNLIFGPLEAGFTVDQITRLFATAGPCATPGFSAPGGLDTLIAEEAIEYACGFNTSILDACGGHAKNPYHYHERLTCLWDIEDSSGHASRAGVMLDAQGLYGYWEALNTLPVLDACGGHFGFTPDSPTQRVYHYHITIYAPFTVGCFGPKISEGVDEMVTLADCRAAVPECDGVDLISVTTTHGTVDYDPDCPCYDGNGSSVTTVPLPFEVAPTGTSPITTSPESPISETTSTAATPLTETVTSLPLPSVLVFMPDDMEFLWPEQPPFPTTGAATIYDTTLVPNMNRVRSEGVVFTMASVAGPKCAPARFNLLTGRYCSRSVHARAAGSPARIGVTVPLCKLDGTDVLQTLPHALANAGYHTIMSGKYHLLPRAQDSWTDYAATMDTVRSSGFTADGGTYATNMDRTLPFTHNLEWMTSHTRTEMAAAVHDNSPFFAYFAATGPHGPNYYRALIDGDPFATPNGTLAALPLDTGMPTRETIVDAAPIGTDQAKWAGTIATDYALGALLDKMTSLNVLDTSLVIVLMDHGMIAKEALFEGGVRISMMARYPGVISPNSVMNRPVTTLDIAPTLFELAGITPSFEVDGHSWLGDVTGRPSSVHREVLFAEIDKDRSVLHLPSRTKLISRTGNTLVPGYPASEAAVQLYDLTTDPTEQVNQAGNASYAATLTFLQSLMTCHDLRTARTTQDPSLLCDTAAPTTSPLSTVIPFTSTPTTAMPTTAAPSTPSPSTAVPTSSPSPAPTLRRTTNPTPRPSSMPSQPPSTSVPSPSPTLLPSPAPTTDVSHQGVCVQQFNALAYSSFCPEWAGASYCTKSYAAFMATYCAGSCAEAAGLTLCGNSPTSSPTRADNNLGEAMCGDVLHGNTNTGYNTVGSAGPELLYDFEPSVTGQYTLDSCGSAFDTWLRVFTEDMSTQVASCDDCGPCGTRSVLTMDLTAGEKYVVVIEGYSAQGGEFTLQVNCPAAVVLTENPTFQPTSAPTFPPTAPPTAQSGPSTLAPTTLLTSASLSLALYRINCGGPTITDNTGNVWESDKTYEPGGATAIPSLYTAMDLQFENPLTSDVSDVWETERWSGTGRSDLEYIMPITGPGVYRVVLLFVEMWHPSAGTRVFSVDVQGIAVIEQLDIGAEAGYQSPMIKEVLVQVTTETEIVVQLVSHPESLEGPAIYGIALVRETNDPLSTSTVAPTPPMTTEFDFIHRINCGGGSVLDADGEVWVADAAYSPGGNVIAPATHISVALDPSIAATTQYAQLWATERWSAVAHGGLEYVLAVSQPGTYRVVLLFVEMWHPREGTRVFSVDVQGLRVLTALDVVVEAGLQTPLIKEVVVEVTTETSVRVKLVPDSGSVKGPEIYGLALVRETNDPLATSTVAPTPPMITDDPDFIHRINCGGGSVLDADGEVWVADAAYSPGGGGLAPATYISVALDPSIAATTQYAQLWATERWSAVAHGGLEYVLAVSQPGTYRVVLLFVEMWHPRAGTRVFSVDVQGLRVLTALDVVVEAGLQTPLIKEVVVEVTTETSVRVKLVPDSGSVEGPAIYGLALIREPTDATIPTSPAATLSPSTETVLRVNCGGPAVLDASGNEWASDAMYSPNGKTIVPADHISINTPFSSVAADLATVLATERWTRYGKPDLDYSLAVPQAGTYHLELVLAENWHRTVGTRVFDVEVQGSVAIASLDLLSEAGFQVPLIKTILVTIPEGAVNAGIRVRLVSHADVDEGPAIYGLSLVRIVP